MKSFVQFRSRILPATAIAFSAFALTSCVVGPDYRRPEVNAPAAFKRTASGETTATVVPADWWRLFNDAELNTLAEKTLAANFDIKVAIARFDQARAAVRVASGEYFPTADLDPTARRSRSITTGKTQTSYSLPVDLGYELDLWGRVRRSVEASRNTALASQADLAFVQQSTLATLAQAYFTLRLLDTEIGIYEKNSDLFRKQLELTQTKFNAGLALQTDVLQAQTQTNSVSGQLLDARRAREKQEHAIAYLLGVAPADFFLPSHPLDTSVPAVPIGLPAALLNQRADVAAAEHQLAAANAQVGVAQAAFYPSFSLTGSAGYTSSSLSGLTDWSNRVWSIGPSIDLPLFRGGALRGTLAQRRAAYQELVATYRQSIVGAWRDVENQLTDLHLLAEKSTLLADTLASAREYSRLTEIQYRQGIVTYLQVIDANQTLLSNELSSAQTQNDRLVATILLIKAIGGGWSAPQS